ncbi:MAG TPA: hypothetical protein VN764_06555 [Polyangiaceae bacterium]|nr:hypothetical protein [Polyangiaceae bacterium]
MARVNSIKRPTVRDQAASPFSSILVELCTATGARCAALVDQEGETVDYGGSGDPFDIRILAAEWRLVLAQFQSAVTLGRVAQLFVRARDKSFWIEALPYGYALVVHMGHRCTHLSPRALSQARRDLCREAGFSLADQTEMWTRVVVKEESRASRRPLMLGQENEAHYLTVLGRVSSVAKRERGFRVRLGTGEERTLVREPLGQWYMEEERFK